jgi:hypothetical protein
MSRRKLISRITGFKPSNPEIKSFNSRFKPGDDVEFENELNQKISGSIWSEAFLDTETNKSLVKVFVKGQKKNTIYVISISKVLRLKNYSL